MPLLEGRGPLQVSRPLTYLGNGKSAVTAKVGQSLSNRSIRESGWSDLLFPVSNPAAEWRDLSHFSPRLHLQTNGYRSPFFGGRRRLASRRFPSGSVRSSESSHASPFPRYAL